MVDVLVVLQRQASMVEMVIVSDWSVLLMKDALGEKDEMVIVSGSFVAAPCVLTACVLVVRGHKMLHAAAGTILHHVQCRMMHQEGCS